MGGHEAEVWIVLVLGQARRTQCTVFTKRHVLHLVHVFHPHAVVCSARGAVRECPLRRVWPARIAIRVIKIIIVQEEPDFWQRCHSNTSGGPPTNGSRHPVGVEVGGESACGVHQTIMAATVSMCGHACSRNAALILMVYRHVLQPSRLDVDSRQYFFEKRMQLVVESSRRLHALTGRDAREHHFCCLIKSKVLERLCFFLVEKNTRVRWMGAPHKDATAGNPLRPSV